MLIRGADDIVAWLCAAAAFFALGHTFRHGELVRVGLLHRPPAAARAAAIAEICALAVTALFVAYMLWAVARFVYESWKFNEVAQGLIKIPIWIPQMSFVVGVADLLHRRAGRAGHGAAEREARLSSSPRRQRARCRRFLARRYERPRRRLVLLALLLVLLAGGVWIAIALARGGLVRAAVLHHHARPR